LKRIQLLDFFVGLLIIAGSTSFFFLSFKFPRAIGGIPGPGLFPQLILGALIFLGILTIVSSFRAKGTYRKAKIQTDWQPYWYVVIFTSFIAVYGVFVMVGWFVYITPIFLFGSTLALMKFNSKPINYGFLVVLSLCLTAVLYFVFIKILHIPLQ